MLVSEGVELHIAANAPVDARAQPFERDSTTAGSLGRMLASPRLSVFEALADENDVGLTIPEIVRATRLPTSSVHRVMHDFVSNGIVSIVGRRRKAPIYRANSEDASVVEAARAVQFYALRIAELRMRTAIRSLPSAASSELCLPWAPEFSVKFFEAEYQNRAEEGMIDSRELIVYPTG